jgi:hypothetical protein
MSPVCLSDNVVTMPANAVPMSVYLAELCKELACCLLAGYRSVCLSVQQSCIGAVPAHLTVHLPVGVTELCRDSGCLPGCSPICLSDRAVCGLSLPTWLSPCLSPNRADYMALVKRWADRYFRPLVRCPADYRNDSGPADCKNCGPAKLSFRYCAVLHFFGLLLKIFQREEFIK